MDLSLEGRVARLMVGSWGIGKAIAEELAKEGADIAVCARGEDALQATATALRKHGTRGPGRPGGCHQARRRIEGRRRDGPGVRSPRRPIQQRRRHRTRPLGGDVG